MLCNVIFLIKGYKVARIEQTETPQMMDERIKTMKRPTKFDRVVNRELCRITTKGTKTLSAIDADSMTDSNSYLLSVCEIVSLEIFVMYLFNELLCFE